MSKESIAIIGGADEPSSVFVAGRTDAVEADITQRKYASQKNCLKESLISRYWNIFGISYSGSKGTMRQMKEIAKDLYLYYGVSEEDIRQKSERYHSLLATLSI